MHTHHELVLPALAAPFGTCAHNSPQNVLYELIAGLVAHI